MMSEALLILLPPKYFFFQDFISQGSRLYACWARGRRGLVPWMEILPGLLQCQVGRGFTASTAAHPTRRSLFRGVEGDGGFPSACGEGDDRRRPLSGG